MGEPVSQFHAALDGHLFHVAEFVLLFRGHVLRWWQHPCSSDGALLGLATHSKSPIAYCLLGFPPHFFRLEDYDYSATPRRLLLLESGAWPVVLVSRSAVRERVPWPNPRLAVLDTCRRISSIEVLRLLSELGRRSTSQRIFGFRVSPVHDSFSFCRLAIQRIASYMLLYGTGCFHCRIPCSVHTFFV